MIATGVRRRCSVATRASPFRVRCGPLRGNMRVEAIDRVARGFGKKRGDDGVNQAGKADRDQLEPDLCRACAMFAPAHSEAAGMLDEEPLGQITVVVHRVHHPSEKW